MEHPARYMPPLPPGYTAQPAWTFSDRSGRYTYEFNRVYGACDPPDERGATCRLAPELSFWCVTWPTTTAGERVAGRWLTFAEARALPGKRISYQRFSSLVEMRPKLEALLHAGEAGREPSAVAAPASGWVPRPV